MTERKWAKEYFEQIRWQKLRIRQLEDKLKDLRDQQGSTKSFDYSSDKVQSCFKGYVGEDLAIRIMDTEQQISEEYERLNALKDRIREEINSLDNVNYSYVLTYKYCEGKDLMSIANLMTYSIDWVKHLHVDALKAFEDKFSERGTSVL